MDRTREASVKSEKLTVNVKPLPKEGRPEAFGGAVGRFEVSSHVDKTEVKAEEPVTLTVTLSGRGNIGAVSDIDMPEVPSFRSYDSGGSTNLSKDDRIVQGSKSFTKVYIPSLPGDYTIPPVKLAYFDPAQGRYEIASSKEVLLSVAAGEGAPNGATGHAPAGEILAKDIRYIKTQVPVFSYRGDRLYTRKGFLLFQLLAPAMIIGAYFLRMARDRAGANPMRARARAARRRAGVKLATASSLAREKDRSAAWKALGGALRGYIADIGDMSAVGLTMDDAARRLRELKIPEDLLERSISILEECDAAAFAPRGESTPIPDETIRLTEETIDRLESARINR